MLYSAADVNCFNTRKLINRHRLGGCLFSMLFDLLCLIIIGILVWH